VKFPLPNVVGVEATVDGEILVMSGGGEPATVNANAAAGATAPPVTCALHVPGVFSTMFADSDVAETPVSDAPVSLVNTPAGDDKTSVGDAGKLEPLTVRLWGEMETERAGDTPVTLGATAGGGCVVIIVELESPPHAAATSERLPRDHNVSFRIRES
jgi:hypothetical protein